MFDAIKYKHSGADINYDMDFAAEIPTSDAITSQTVTIVDSAGNVPTGIITSSSISGTNVRARITAGVDLQDYRLTFTAVMASSGEDRVKVLLLKVRDNRMG